MGIYDDIGLLRTFVSIVESGSISAAARRMRSTQPTLSRQLQTLESTCGTSLLRRDTHRMHLTDTGHRLLLDARSMLSLAEEAEHRLRNDQTELRGKIHIFATIDFGQTVVSRLCAAFLQANPSVNIELAYTNRPLHMLEEGCDAGIIAGRVTDESIVARQLGPIQRYPVAAPSYLLGRTPLTRPTQLEKCKWLALSGESFGGAREVRLISAKGDVRFSISPILLSEGVTSLREAVRMGLGVAVLPLWLIEEDLLSGRLVRVLPKWWAEELVAHIVYPVDHHLPQRVRSFIDFAAEYMMPVLKPAK
jgi:DNA-binding transcriptional LysR family regulator